MPNEITPGAKHLLNYLQRILARQSGPKKEELKDLEKELAALTDEDIDSIVPSGILGVMCENLDVQVLFEACTKVLMHFAGYHSAAAEMVNPTPAQWKQYDVIWLGGFLMKLCRESRQEKEIERAISVAKILVLFSLDLPADKLLWTEELADQLRSAISVHNLQPPKGLQDAYALLSIILPALWTCMGTSLAPIIATAVCRRGGMPSLIRVAKEVQRSDIKGLPKIIGEKALNLLCACNAEQPQLSVSEVPPLAMADFCVDTASKSDWVQSQELSVVLLGRLVFLQQVVAPSYVEGDKVVSMLRMLLKAKSPALRMTAACFCSIAPEAVFKQLDLEVQVVLQETADGTDRSLKQLSAPSAGGMTILRWGLPLGQEARSAWQHSKLVTRMVELCPLYVPPLLMDSKVLTPSQEQYVKNMKEHYNWNDGGAVAATANASASTGKADEGAATESAVAAAATDAVSNVNVVPKQEPSAGWGAAGPVTMTGAPDAKEDDKSEVMKAIGQAVAAAADSYFEQPRVVAAASSPSPAPTQAASCAQALLQKLRERGQGSNGGKGGSVAGGAGAWGDQAATPVRGAAAGSVSSGGQGAGTGMSPAAAAPAPRSAAPRLASLSELAQMPSAMPVVMAGGGGAVMGSVPAHLLQPGQLMTVQMAGADGQPVILAAPGQYVMQPTMQYVQQQQQPEEPAMVVDGGAAGGGDVSGSWWPRGAQVPSGQRSRSVSEGGSQDGPPSKRVRTSRDPRLGTEGIGVQSSLPPLPTQQALTQPLPVLQPQPSPQFHHQGASSGAVPATGSAGGAGGASRAFGSKEMSELSSFFYTTVMESQRKLDKEGQDVVATLLKACSSVGKIVRAKVDLAGDTAAQWDDALHEWAGRARTMATDMLEGRSLNMELMSMMTSMMVDETATFLKQVEKQVSEQKGVA